MLRPRPLRGPAGLRRVWADAWPIILANSAVPLLGLADTAVIGHTGAAAGLGAVALGALVFNFLYWGFGFLRMGTTGFVAQADGAGDEAEVRAAFGRALLLGAVLGALLLLLQWPVAWVALRLLGASAEVEALTRGYLLIRIWSAPASLALYALIGLFVGLGRSGLLLRAQLFLNGLNIVLDAVFAGVLGWGVAGIAFGTALAEWLALAYAGALAYGLLQGRRRSPEPFWSRARIADLNKLKRTIAANADIMVRTLFLLFGFAWFADQGARYGDVVLAANHILLQFVSLSAFFLDGFAFAAEPLVGRAAGAARRDLFDQAVWSSTLLSAGTALGLALLILTLGHHAIAALTDLDSVRATAAVYLPYAACYVLASFAAFQLDGIFIGATGTRALRNASILSTVVFLAAWWALAGRSGNHGLWVAFIVFVIARAVALGWHYPALRAGIDRPGGVRSSRG